jgi:hypothetical protein
MDERASPYFPFSCYLCYVRVYSYVSNQNDDYKLEPRMPFDPRSTDGALNAIATRIYHAKELEGNAAF